MLLNLLWIKNQLTAWQGATAVLSVLWDENYVYALMEVKDSMLNKDSMHRLMTVTSQVLGKALLSLVI